MVRLRSKFSAETAKPIGDNMKTQRVELTNILHLLKNMCTWLTQKHRNSCITFKCQKILWNIALTIKASLRVKNRTQYTNHQMNYASKNQIYNTSLWNDCLKWLYQMIVLLSPKLVISLSYDMRNEQICITIIISRRLASLHIVGD